MAYTITSESYGPRKPLVTIEADSLDDISGLTNFAEGSTANVGGTEYTLDKVQGWIVPGSSGSGGGALIVRQTYDEATSTVTLDKTFLEIDTALKNGPVLILIEDYDDMGLSCQYLIFQTVYNWGDDMASPADGGKVLALQIEKASGTSAMLTVYEYSAATGDDYPARTVS